MRACQKHNKPAYPPVCILKSVGSILNGNVVNHVDTGQVVAGPDNADVAEIHNLFLLVIIGIDQFKGHGANMARLDFHANLQYLGSPFENAGHVAVNNTTDGDIGRCLRGLNLEEKNPILRGYVYVRI